jgi:hypothetical protein
MFKVNPVIIVLLAVLALNSCSKKIHPSQPGANTGTTENNTEMAKKEPVKVKLKLAIPKVITVNDKAARKSVDGRYYYDLQGHRYWRNNVDGKYYLFNKSMFTDEAFKAKVN